MSQGYYQGFFSLADGNHEPVATGNLLADMFNSQAADFVAGQRSAAEHTVPPPPYSGDWFAPGTHVASPMTKSPAQQHNFPGLNAAAVPLFLLNSHQPKPALSPAMAPPPSGHNPNYFPADQAELGVSIAAAQVLRRSRYARAAQELLEEFCSVVRSQINARERRVKRQSSIISGASQGQSSGGGAAAKEFPVDRFQQERKKAQLLDMLDQIERRYNRYSEQMKAVVSSFDSVMGLGAAFPYTSLAHKAMSRHFRVIKDAISAQLRITCLLLGDKDGGLAAASCGLSKGETPRLRLLEQSLWRQRSQIHGGGFDQETWRPQRGLPECSVKVLRAWLFEHFLHPYPTDADKHSLARQTGLSRSQVSNWFINARVRLWKPMVEEMYQKEAADPPPPLEASGEGSSPSHPLGVPWEPAAAAPLLAGDVSLTLGRQQPGPPQPARWQFPGDGF